MTFLVLLTCIVAAVGIGMAVPPALKEKSWLRFFIAAFLSAFGIVVPLFVFWASAFLVPDWKGGCPHGWLDCFHTGKLALTPVVLWASAAWYAVEVYRVEQPTRPWIVLGFTIGALVSLVCLVFGRVSTGTEDGGMRWCLAVPFYVSVWYVARAIQLSAAAGLRPAAYVWAVCGSLPLWIASLFWSRYCYQSLPDHPPSCFVVTAAARGHRRLVGPFLAIPRHGGGRLANHQLLTFWRLEAAWSARAPRSHRAFRLLYNRLAPAVARRITSPWTADMVFLLIKPAELVAGLTLRIRSNRIIPLCADAACPFHRRGRQSPLPTTKEWGEGEGEGRRTASLQCAQTPLPSPLPARPSRGEGAAATHYEVSQLSAPSPQPVSWGGTAHP